MAGSILIYGGNKQEREALLVEKISKIYGKDFANKKDLSNLVDINIIQTENDKKTIGIGQIREGIKFLSEKPFNSKYKALVVFESEKLTREAQNALLKTLEEPPFYAHIILESKTEKDLLETVVSRCRKIDARYLKRKVEEIETVSLLSAGIVEIVNMEIGDRLKLIDEIDTNNRDFMIDVLEEWIKNLRKEMLTKPSIKIQKGIETIIEHKKDLEKTNVSGKFSIETLLINL